MSADAQARNDEFARSLGLPYPLVGDPGGKILRAYRVRWPVIGLARRVSYVIGRNRKVRMVHATELDADSHVAETCAFLARRPAG